MSSPWKFCHHRLPVTPVMPLRKREDPVFNRGKTGYVRRGSQVSAIKSVSCIFFTNGKSTDLNGLGEERGEREGKASNRSWPVRPAPSSCLPDGNSRKLTVFETVSSVSPAAAPSLQGPLVPPCGPGQERRPWWPEEAWECARPAGTPQRPGPGHPPPWSQTETCGGDPGFSRAYSRGLSASPPEDRSAAGWVHLALRPCWWACLWGQLLGTRCVLGVCRFPPSRVPR